MKKEHFQLINGYPNNIWGWGIEDRALYYRCHIKNVSMSPIYNSLKDRDKFIILHHKSYL